MEKFYHRLKFHPAWLILGCCCLFQLGCTGILNNCTGVFFPAVSEDLGISVGQLSLSPTLRGLTSLLMMPLVGYLLPRCNIRLLLGGATIGGAACMAVMALFTHITQWYVAGAVMGLFGSFIFLVPVPVIIGNWFAKKAGLATGIAMAFSGLGGAGMNMVASWAITTWSWRAAYLLLAACCLLFALPVTLIFLRFRPADVGLTPYGAAEEDAQQTPADALTGSTRAQAMRSPAFYLLLAAAFCLSLSACFPQHFSSYGRSVGWSLTLASLLTSMSMVGNVGGKLATGWLSDRIGARATTLLGLAGITISFVLLLAPHGVVGLTLFAAALTGLSMPLTSVCVPLMVRDLFGTRAYSAIYATMSMGVAFGSMGFGIIGVLYDSTGSYAVSFWMGIGLCAAAIVSISLAYKTAPKKT